MRFNIEIKDTHGNKVFNIETDSTPFYSEFTDTFNFQFDSLYMTLTREAFDKLMNGDKYYVG